MNAVKKAFPVDGKKPELATVIQFLTVWFKTDYIDCGIWRANGPPVTASAMFSAPIPVPTPTADMSLIVAKAHTTRWILWI